MVIDNYLVITNFYNFLYNFRKETFIKNMSVILKYILSLANSLCSISFHGSIQNFIIWKTENAKIADILYNKKKCLSLTFHHDLTEIATYKYLRMKKKVVQLICFWYFENHYNMYQ